jgi:5'-phosphate synthase pdxT subunit
MKRNATTSTTHLPDAKKQKTTTTTDNHLTIGVLALQEAFREHVEHLKQMEHVAVCEIRNASELLGLDGLVIPGGESTAIAKIATRFGAASDDGLFARLQDWIATEQKPIWGTCAGLIFLANTIVGGGRKQMGNP